jgi:hypothetical protein
MVNTCLILLENHALTKASIAKQNLSTVFTTLDSLAQSHSLCLVLLTTTVHISCWCIAYVYYFHHCVNQWIVFLNLWCTYIRMISCSFLNFSKQAACAKKHGLHIPFTIPLFRLSWGHLGLALFVAEMWQTVAKQAFLYHVGFLWLLWLNLAVSCFFFEITSFHSLLASVCLPTIFDKSLGLSWGHLGLAERGMWQTAEQQCPHFSRRG